MIERKNVNWVGAEPKRQNMEILTIDFFMKYWLAPTQPLFFWISIKSRMIWQSIAEKKFPRIYCDFLEISKDYMLFFSSKNWKLEPLRISVQCLWQPIVMVQNNKKTFIWTKSVEKYQSYDKIMKICDLWAKPGNKKPQFLTLSWPHAHCGLS